jgi:hypothetical protein
VKNNIKKNIKEAIVLCTGYTLARMLQRIIHSRRPGIPYIKTITVTAYTGLLLNGYFNNISKDTPPIQPETTFNIVKDTTYIDLIPYEYAANKDTTITKDYINKDTIDTLIN